jgi:hypothetical protein
VLLNHYCSEVQVVVYFSKNGKDEHKLAMKLTMKRIVHQGWLFDVGCLV